MKIFNSLTKKKEKFKPLKKGEVSMYHCGPTVYDYVHIGNLRSFFMADIIRRTFEYLGYKVTQVINITDVGHLISDGDDGNDKMTKALKRHNMEITLKNMLKVGEIYTEAFKKDLKKLNILTPHYLPKASDNIEEDIKIISILEKKGYTYITSDGIYFNTKKMKDYGKLGGLNLDEKSQPRVCINTEKKFHADFALWKFDDKNGWNSPWGHGFPGWHIECSGMSMKYLGETIDIHTGGYDLKSVHHNNEIAQSECSTGKTFVHYWVHGEFLNINGKKLSKSKGNNLTLTNLKEKGFSPLDMRYLFLQSVYRSQTDFTWDILQSSKSSLERIYKQINKLKSKNSIGIINEDFKSKFKEAISDDFNTPEALAIFHTMLKSNIPDADKLATAYDFDYILGINLENFKEKEMEIPSEIISLLEKRKQARKDMDWDRSDELRNKIKEKGFKILDSKDKQEIEKI